MWTVTRQIRWPDGIHIVEISQGGYDHCNPDALVDVYQGEEYESPVDAVEAAIEVAKAWQGDTTATVYLGMGCTHGSTAHFDEEELTEEVFAALRSEAQDIHDNLPKCDRCGKVLGKEKYRRADDWTGERFCSSYCVEEAERFDEEVMAEEEMDEEEDADLEN